MELDYREVSDGVMDIGDFSLDGTHILHLEVDRSNRREKPLYGITWHTNVSTQEGLDAIRQSYSRLKERYGEVHELEGDDGNKEGCAIFCLKGSSTLSGDADISTLDMPHFMDPRALDGVLQQNSFYWIRVETGYLVYYLGGVSESSRPLGVIGDHNVVDEVSRLLTETSKTELSDNQLVEVQGRLEKMLQKFSKFGEK